VPPAAAGVEFGDYGLNDTRCCTRTRTACPRTLPGRKTLFMTISLAGSLNAGFVLLNTRKPAISGCPVVSTTNWATTRPPMPARSSTGG